MPGQRFGPAWFPGLIAVGLGLCGACLVAIGLRDGAAWVAVPEWTRHRRPVAGVAAVIAGLILYTLLADKLGFYLSALPLLILWMRVLGASWRVTVPVAVVATLVIHLSFYKLLRIPLPWGVLERWAF
jgi:putative tricarboxylic transport membrane protein